MESKNVYNYKRVIQGADLGTIRPSTFRRNVIDKPTRQCMDVSGIGFNEAALFDVLSSHWAAKLVESGCAAIVWAIGQK
jgi:hypothetical protein